MTNEERIKEDYIGGAHISVARVERFKANYAADRANSATLEWAFKRAGSYTLVESSPVDPFGLYTSFHKGPFVDNSSWAEYTTWDLAVGMERFVLGGFLNLLESPKVNRSDKRLTSAGLLAIVDDMITKLEQKGLQPSLILLAGQIPTYTAVRLWQSPGVTPDWNLDKEIPKLWLGGLYMGIPFMQFREGDVGTVHVIDLARFGQMKQVNGALVEVAGISKARAEEIIGKNPNAVQLPDDAPDTIEERIRQMMLRVEVKLTENLWIEAADAAAALSKNVVLADERLPGEH